MALDLRILRNLAKGTQLQQLEILRFVAAELVDQMLTTLIL